MSKIETIIWNWNESNDDAYPELFIIIQDMELLNAELFKTRRCKDQRKLNIECAVQQLVKPTSQIATNPNPKKLKPLGKFLNSLVRLRV